MVNSNNTETQTVSFDAKGRHHTTRIWLASIHTLIYDPSLYYDRVNLNILNISDIHIYYIYSDRSCRRLAIIDRQFNLWVRLAPIFFNSCAANAYSDRISPQVFSSPKMGAGYTCMLYEWIRPKKASWVRTRGISNYILGDPGAVSRVDIMFVVKVYCKIETRSYSKLWLRLTASGSRRM